MAPSDLFGYLKKELGGRRSNNEVELKEAILAHFADKALTYNIPKTFSHFLEQVNRQ